VRAHAGANAFRLRMPRLHRGRYVMRIRGGGASARVTFRVR
jgi:hypothetical protein